MSRRLAGGALAAAAVVVPVPGARAVAPARPQPQVPRSACAAHVTDDRDDAKVNFDPVATASRVDDPRGSTDGLDITAVTIRVTDTKVVAYLTLKDLPTSLGPTEQGYWFFVSFAFGKKVARFQHAIGNPTYGTLQPTGYPIASVGEGTASGTTPLRGLGADVDPVHDVVDVYGDRDSLEQQLGTALHDGDVLTAVTGKTALILGPAGVSASQHPADDTTATGDKAAYTVGDDSCFDPAQLTVAAAPAQYGDPATLTATLKYTDGKPMAGRALAFDVPGQPDMPRTVVTGDDGTATVGVDAAQPGQAYAVTFAGDETIGRARVAGTLDVRPETVRFAPLQVTKAGTARTVTATLLDDDAHPVSGVKVDWYVAGAKVATATTDSRGRVTLRTAKAGQKVQARFAAVPAKYAAATSATVTA